MYSQCCFTAAQHFLLGMNNMSELEEALDILPLSGYQPTVVSLVCQWSIQYVRCVMQCNNRLLHLCTQSTGCQFTLRWCHHRCGNAQLQTCSDGTADTHVANMMHMVPSRYSCAYVLSEAMSAERINGINSWSFIASGSLTCRSHHIRH